MVFSSYIFLFGFLPAVLVAYYVSPRILKSLVLTLASYVFYGWWRPDFVLLMLASTFLDYFCGRRIAGVDGRARRGYLLLSIIGNLGLLGYFKYMNFGVETLNQLLTSFGMNAVSWPHVVLPVGISFYTFQSMSYTIDIYRGVSEPQNRFIDFACYVSLFPQLVAGPIIRYNTLADQLQYREHDFSKFATGVLFFQLGLGKKILIADNVAPLADESFLMSLAGDPTSMLDAWLGTLAYALQIYFDFSGYSDMAIGLGMMFGFVYPANFDAPYKSKSITEFWRRWHISLSTWLRDYLYIPLGGNRKGPLRTYVNLALTMLLGGLWHGAAVTFVVWGAYQGALLAFERMIGKRPLYRFLPGSVRMALTFVLVLVGWVFFRSPDMTTAWRHLGAMFGATSAGAVELGRLQLRSGPVLAVLVGCLIVWTARTTQALLESPRAATMIWAGIVFLAAVCQLYFSSYSPFLYFQF